VRSHLAQHSRTAKLAVTAAGLALAGLTLAALARWSATGVVDSARAEASVTAERLGSLLSTAIATGRLRAEGLAAMPTVRAAIETDVATVRDMARAEGFVFTPAAHETVEIFQVPPHKRPLSLLRAPETSQSLAIARANEVRVDEEGGALVVTVAVPARPLTPRGGLEGAVAVATRVNLSSLAASLAPTGLSADLEGAGEPVPLSAQHPPDGARYVVVPVPLGDIAARGTPPRLTIRAAVRAGGGATLWAGRVLLVAAFFAALLTFATNRRLAMPSLDDAPTARRETHAQPNAPSQPIAPLPTAKEKRGNDARALEDAGRRPVLAWNAPMPTPITQLRPAMESVPLLLDPRGDQLAGRYRLLQSLGRGHSADVYLAQSFVPGAASTVALKILSAPDSPDRAAFLETARSQMRIAHGNVARVLDVAPGAASGDVAYVAMEYVEGCTLETLLRDLFARDESLPLPQTIAIMAAICRALDAARPLIHGAVKPSNVLVSRHNIVKLADFGAPPSATDRHAPEQYAGRSADRRSDVYAAGVVLHELITGRRLDVPFDANLADARRWPPLPAPSTLRPGLPPALDALVAKATRFGPRGRFATAGELLAALLHATEDAIPSTSTAWLGDWVERARRSS
jgi:hypothetical protein